MVYVEDLINSLLKYLQEEEFTGQASAGVEATGTLVELYPDLERDDKPHFFPTRVAENGEVAFPAVAMSINNSRVRVESVFGADVWEYTGRLIIIGTAPDQEQADEKDFDASVVQTMRLQATLENHFQGDEYGPMQRQIPWYRWLNNEDGETELIGTFSVVEFQATAVDDNRSIIQLALEVID